MDNEINRKKIIYNTKKKYESYYFLKKQILNQLRLSVNNISISVRSFNLEIIKIKNGNLKQ